MKFFLLVVFLFSLNGFSEINTIARSPRGLLMGDAFTAVADDEYALFYNPAALGRHEGFSFNSFNPLITLINPLNNLDLVENFPTDTAGLANAVLGIPIKTSAGITPGFRMGRFGFSAFYNTEIAFNLMDQTQPVLDLKYKEDRGFIAGYALKMNENLSLGLGVKYLKRAGLKGMFPLFGTDLGNASGNNINEIAESLGKNNASGWGFDFGMEHVSTNGATRFINSFVMKDMFNLRLNHENPGSEVPAQDMAVNIGSAVQQKYEFFTATFSVDIRNLIEEQELLRRVHAGVEISIPGLSILGGWRTGYYSYGVKFNAFLFEIYAGIFSEELNPGYKQQRADQALIYLSFFNFRFNE